jgi:hypothetical protein
LQSPHGVFGCLPEVYNLVALERVTTSENASRYGLQSLIGPRKRLDINFHDWADSTVVCCDSQKQHVQK